MYNPYAGTVIGADGKRYAVGDPDIPTVAPDRPGKFVTAAVFEPLDDQVQGAVVRVVDDAVTVNADATLTSADADFTGADKGASVTGVGIPAGTTIATVTDQGSVEMSAAATAAGTGVVVTIKRDLGGIINDHEARIEVLEP